MSACCSNALQLTKLRARLEVKLPVSLPKLYSIRFAKLFLISAIVQMIESDRAASSSYSVVVRIFIVLLVN